VSGTTEGRGGDYFNLPTPTPFPLGALNASTANLTLGALPDEWSSSKHGFHGMQMQTRLQLSPVHANVQFVHRLYPQQFPQF
jgi:vacuolar protein sorting-associated protein 54